MTVPFLPPEILIQILTHAVNTRPSFARVLRLRLVCKLFSAELPEAVWKSRTENREARKYIAKKKDTFKVFLAQECLKLRDDSPQPWWAIRQVAEAIWHYQNPESTSAIPIAELRALIQDVAYLSIESGHYLPRRYSTVKPRLGRIPEDSKHFTEILFSAAAFKGQVQLVKEILKPPQLHGLVGNVIPSAPARPQISPQHWPSDFIDPLPAALLGGNDEIINMLLVDGSNLSPRDTKKRKWLSYYGIKTGNLKLVEKAIQRQKLYWEDHALDAHHYEIVITDAIDKTTSETLFLTYFSRYKDWVESLTVDKANYYLYGANKSMQRQRDNTVCVQGLRGMVRRRVQLGQVDAVKNLMSAGLQLCRKLGPNYEPPESFWSGFSSNDPELSYLVTLAAENGHQEMVEYLLDSGIPPGDALSGACYIGYRHIIELLLSRQDAHEAQEQLQLGYMIAMRRENTSLLQFLRDKGAIVEPSTIISARDQARDEGWHSTVNMLEADLARLGIAAAD